MTIEKKCPTTAQEAAPNGGARPWLYMFSRITKGPYFTFYWVLSVECANRPIEPSRDC